MVYTVISTITSTIGCQDITLVFERAIYLHWALAIGCKEKNINGIDNIKT